MAFISPGGILKKAYNLFLTDVAVAPPDTSSNRVRILSHTTGGGGPGQMIYFSTYQVDFPSLIPLNEAFDSFHAGSNVFFEEGVYVVGFNGSGSVLNATSVDVSTVPVAFEFQVLPQQSGGVGLNPQLGVYCVVGPAYQPNSSLSSQVIATYIDSDGSVHGFGTPGNPPTISPNLIGNILGCVLAGSSARFYVNGVIVSTASLANANACFAGAGFIGNAAIPYSGPFDIESANALVGWSLRALSNSFAGSASAVIRRASDSATMSMLTSSATGRPNQDGVLNFIDGTEGYPSFWVDQTGRGISFVQTTNHIHFVGAAANQNPGFGNNPIEGTALFEYGSGAGFGLTAGEDITVFLVMNIAALNEPEEILAVVNRGDSGVLSLVAGAAEFVIGTTNNAGTAGASFALNTDLTGFHIFDIGINGATSFTDMKVDGAAVTLDSSGYVAGLTPTLNLVDATSTPPSLSALDGTSQVFEMLVFKSTMSTATRTRIRQNIAAYYGIAI